jgi:hypothetical protein
MKGTNGNMIPFARRENVCSGTTSQLAGTYMTQDCGLKESHLKCLIRLTQAFSAFVRLGKVSGFLRTWPRYRGVSWSNFFRNSLNLFPSLFSYMADKS